MVNMPDGITIVCGHRGAAARAPENTLAALELAVSVEAPMAEIDVRLTADGRPVLFHDHGLGRTAPGLGPIADHTLEELRRLDAGSWFAAEFAGQRICGLGEALDLAADSLRLNIELKNDGLSDQRTNALAEAVLAEIAGRDAAGRCLLTSFDHGLIDAVALANPHLECGRIIGRPPLGDPGDSGPGRVLSVRHGFLDGYFVAAAHAASKIVHAWTVNDESGLRRMVGWKVDVVITDDPQWAMAALARFRTDRPPRR